MNLTALQTHDYEASCQLVDDLDYTKEKWGLWLYSPGINDVDSYLMDWIAIKTLHDNIERLYQRLNKEIKKHLESE